MCGIHHQMSCPYTSAQSGREECKHRHITKTCLALAFHASVSLTYWVEAFKASVFPINRLPSSRLRG